MSFRMLLIAGHGRNADGSYDPGACGCGYREADLTRELTKLIKSCSDAAGVPCDIAPDRNHYSFFRNGGTYDVSKYTYVLEVHFNASGITDYKGDGSMKGSMMYIDKSEKGCSVEESILSNLYKIGSKKAWDGVVITQRQWKNGLVVQNAVRKQGVSHAVLETCFISDADDMKWYHKNKSNIATAIVEGVIRGFKLSGKVKPENQMEKPNMYYIDVNSIYDRCLNIRSKPNSASEINGVIDENMTVTIVETVTNKMNGHTWGRLLSGAGWINLHYAKKI